MAKKKAGSNNIGLILTLVFFVLTTFIAGTVAYFGYTEQEQFKKAAEQAKKDKAASDQQLRVEQVRTVVNRIALGTDTGEDRLKLVAGMIDDESRAAIKKEYDNLIEKLKPNLPKEDDFDWKLIAMDPSRIRETKAGSEYTADVAKNDRDVAPKRVLPAMLKDYKDQRDAAVAAQKRAEDAKKAAEKRAEGLADDRGKAQQNFDAALDKLKAELKANNDKLTKDFDSLKGSLARAGDAAAARIKTIGEEREKLEKEKDDLVRKLDEVTKKLVKYDQMSTPLAGGPDLIAQDEKKGEIISKEGSFLRGSIQPPGRFPTIEGNPNEGKGLFVNINIGSAQKLKPGVTFAVLPRDASWRTPEEKERLIKGQIEVVEIIGPYTAKARVISELEPIRDPIQVKDQLFNLAWNPNEEIRVAFAGIIDLDGDGLDNNAEFLSLLERQGVIVDEYLKLRPLEFVKRNQKGLGLQTRYLIIAPDPRLEDAGPNPSSPQRIQMQAILEKMSEIKARARDNGVQLIEARKFLAMIGVKVPASKSGPAYNAGIYIDQGGVPMPPAERQ